MEVTENKEERAERFSRIWWKSRMEAKKSQEYMALSLGVSKRTVQNWEKGRTFPDLFQSTEWFRVLGLNPLHYYLEYLYPDMFNKPQSKGDCEWLDRSLMDLVRNSTTLEKQQLLYMMSGAHGSSWYSLLQMFTAHCHTSMKSRVAAARIIAENYEMEMQSGDLVCAEEAAPDLRVLNYAISQGKQAVQDRKQGYTAQTEID